MIYCSFLNFDELDPPINRSKETAVLGLRSIQKSEKHRRSIKNMRSSSRSSQRVSYEEEDDERDDTTGEEQVEVLPKSKRSKSSSSKRKEKDYDSEEDSENNMNTPNQEKIIKKQRTNKKEKSLAHIANTDEEDQLHSRLVAKMHAEATEEDEEVEQGVGAQVRIREDTSTPQAGQILYITVQNFMCHHKITVDFCAHINFVTGQNGSGTFTYLLNLSISTLSNHMYTITYQASLRSWQQYSYA